MKTYSLFDINTRAVTDIMYTIDDDEYMLEYANSINKGLYYGDSEIGAIVSDDGLSIVGKATIMSDILDDLNTGGKNLTSLIEQLPEVMSGQITASDWTKQHYDILRSKLYPSVLDLADALVKLNSTDQDMKQQGSIELQAYVDKCIEVKTAIPK